MVMFLVFVVLQSRIDYNTRLEESSDYTWIRSFNYLPKIVRPDENTAVFLPINLNETKDRDEVACFVLTAPKHILERNVIRQTWGTLLKPLFLIAKSDSETDRLVISEATIHNDIIVENFIDSYTNLTIKTAFAMKHFLKHFKNSSYFFKIDDDVYLNVSNLKRMLNDDSIPKDIIIRGKTKKSKPHREKGSKFYIPYWLQKEGVFTPYHDGPAYLIPGENKTVLLKLHHG